MEQSLDTSEGHIPVKFLTPKQFMEQTHLSRNTVYEGIRDGSIPSICISKRFLSRQMPLTADWRSCGVIPTLLSGSIGAGTPAEAALSLADRGWPVLPVCWPTQDGGCGCGRAHQDKRIGKAPLSPNGWHDATTAKETIRGWWNAWPDANVAVALGAAGLMAIDCDSKEAIQEAVELGLPETMCRMSRMPAYVYLAPGGAPKINAIHWGDSGHIDLLAGGYLVVYGHHQNGKEIYLEGGLPSPAPRWAVEVILEREKARQAS